MTSIEQIMRRFTTHKRSGCLMWTGSCCTNGYGQTSFYGKQVLTHRLLWELKNGPIPRHLEIDHLCHNKRCANIKHLELVTHQENMNRFHFSLSMRSVRMAFRLEPVLLAECHALATEAGLTLSEWVREILRREVGLTTRKRRGGNHARRDAH